MVYKIKTKRIGKSLLLGGMGLSLMLLATSGFAQLKYYRYINKDGVKVISHTIPPEYAQKGYEVMTHTGKVIEVVAPAPDPKEAQAELEKRAAERELMAEYEVLARRYSDVDDIYASRDRRLAHLDATIAILRSNIGNLHGQIDGLMSKAAQAERSGREVSDQILSNMEEVKAELATTELKLQTRIEERAGIHEEYENAATLFLKGKALEESRTATKDPSN